MIGRDALDRARLEHAEMARLRIKDASLARKLDRYWRYNILMKGAYLGRAEWSGYMMTLACSVRVIPTPGDLA
jgi:hypothetical protein